MFVNCCSEIGANCYYIICMHNTHEPNHGHLYGHMISLQYLRHGFFFVHRSPQICVGSDRHFESGEELGDEVWYPLAHCCFIE